MRRTIDSVSFMRRVIWMTFLSNPLRVKFKKFSASLPLSVKQQNPSAN